MTEQHPKAGRREWIGLAVIALPCMLYSMDLTVLNLAVPSLSETLRPTSTQLLWIVDIYGFLVAGSLITMGTLGDRIGRRRLLLIGAAAFGLASIMAAYSTSAEMLIATRALLGIAGATLAPSTLSLIRNMFLDARQRTFAIGVWATSYSVGAAVGPLLGGILLEYFWWGSVFLIGVPVMLLLLTIGPRLLPEYRDPAPGRFDLLSAGMSLVSVLAVIFGFKRMAEYGVEWAAVIALLVGLAVGTLFVRRQQRLRDPLIDLGLFRAPGFGAALVTNLVTIFAAFGPFVFIAQYLQLVLALSPLQAGIWMFPSSLGFVVGSMGAPVLVRWMRPAYAVAASLIVAAGGLLIITVARGEYALPILVLGSLLLSLGLAPAVTLSTDLIMGTAPPERAGAAAALSETGAELGGALGIASLGTIGAAVYRGSMQDSVPVGLGLEEAEAAQQTLGGAVVIAEGLPAGLAELLLASGRAAFTEAMLITSLIGVGMLVVTAAMAAVRLRHVQGGGEH